MAVVLTLQWIIVRFSGLHLTPHWEALSAGGAIFGAVFLLSWAAELAQLVSTAPEVRYAYAAVYLVLGIGLLIMDRSRRTAFVDLFFGNRMLGRGVATSSE